MFAPRMTAAVPAPSSTAVPRGRSRAGSLLLVAAIAGVIAAAAYLATARTPPVTVAASPAAPTHPWTSQLLAAQYAASWREVDLLLWFRNASHEETEISTFRIARELFADPVARADLDASFVVVELPYDVDTPVEDVPADFRNLVQFSYSGSGTNGAYTTRRETMLPPLVLADASGRPYACPKLDARASNVDTVRELVAAVSVRERRDAAFDRAARSQGVESADALADGLVAMEDGIVMACYLDELEEIHRLDQDGSAGLREEHAALLGMARSLSAVREVYEVWFTNMVGADTTVTPHRLRDALAPIRRAHADVPEVQQLARLFLAQARIQLVLDDSDLAAIENELRAAKEIAPWSGIVPLLDAASTNVGRSRRGTRK